MNNKRSLSKLNIRLLPKLHRNMTLGDCTCSGNGRMELVAPLQFNFGF